MKDIRIARIPQSESLPVVSTTAAPTAADQRVLVRMRAAALNFADILKSRGQYQEAQPFPFVPGLEGAGEVITAPAESGLMPGDRVAVWAPGTMTEVMAVPADACLKIPDNMSFDQAAGFQIAYGTSHLALVHRAGLQAGETLAVLGAAGGVGLTAVQIGRAIGARVIGVARVPERLGIVAEAGADDLIDSDDSPDLKAALREFGPIDVVYDPVGAEPGLAAFGALRRGGRFLIIGFAGGKPPRLPLNHALVKNIAIYGFYWGGYRDLDRQALRDSLAQCFALFADGKLAPHAGEVLDLDQIAEGYRLLEARKTTGKVIIRL
ncbi:NADPH:quinone oxidoreductase family protein [Paracoccus tegillarcae]|uniref:Zinc-binding dehydrogenase n=1 Tax=Paracoccus tegillarcae TaxID=1529068 RepID=A0A2K9EXR9_9RHOB|nr:NADPH:quinone oxidoreductase family protein [Paracoccus tegillarcae]AUH34104.1 zinc-binding dehydrogenase [Paracoccus tegillarcae]